jgi:hypothetical protein
MTKTKIIAVVGALMLTATSALAQTGSAAPARIFGSVNVGGQTQSRTLNGEFTFPVYSQDATVTTSTGVDAGPIFDLNGGYRFMERFGAGVGFTTFGVTGRTSGAASIPHPSSFNRYASVTIAETDAKRSERAVYLTFVYFYPIDDKTEVAVYGGPSFIHVEQELIGNPSVPVGTQDLNTSINKESANGVGGIVGVDLNYSITDRIGAGGFLRYNGGSVDLASASNVKAGGFQLGVGIRFRY